MAADSTARRWVLILGSMHARSAAQPTPIPASSIARDLALDTSEVERQLRLMARVGLVHSRGRGSRRTWLLGSERA